MASHTITDAELARWSAIYQRNPILRRRGVLLATFLEYPQDIFAAVFFPLLDEEGCPRSGRGGEEEGFRPLLPAQRLVAARLAVAEQLRAAAAAADARIERERFVFRGFAYIEPLHHHAWPRHPARRDLNLMEV